MCHVARLFVRLAMRRAKKLEQRDSDEEERLRRQRSVRINCSVLSEPYNGKKLIETDTPLAKQKKDTVCHHRK